MKRVLVSCDNHKELNVQQARLCRNNLQFTRFGRFTRNNEFYFVVLSTVTESLENTIAHSGTETKSGERLCLRWTAVTSI